jgi:hypothetical protein
MSNIKDRKLAVGISANLLECLQRNIIPDQFRKPKHPNATQQEPGKITTTGRAILSRTIQHLNDEWFLLHRSLRAPKDSRSAHITYTGGNLI